MTVASDTSLDLAATDLRLATFRLARRLRRERALDSMSDAQFAVLAILRQYGTQTLGAIAEREQVTAPSMTRTVNVLEESGYVERVADDADRRRVLISLTAAGAQIVVETIRLRDSSLAEALAELGLEEHELETLRQASALMRRVAER